MTDEQPPLRIGTAERTAAMKALDEHLAAGRLGVEEYGERSAQAANATTAPELAALFTDLPAPHPRLPGVSAPAPPVEPGDASPAVRGGDGLAVWGPRLMAVVPIVAIGLFLLTRSWVFFLLIPAAGALLGAWRRSDS
jgi:Domain of unknown function (DUF1707)